MLKVKLVIVILLLPFSSFSKDSLKVDFSPIGGFFQNTIAVTLKPPVAGASVYYTTDGSAPTSSSYKYKEPIKIVETTVIRAKAYVKGQNTEVQTNTYFVGREFTIPVVSISTNPDNFFSHEQGIYVKGCCADSVQPYQGANFWKGWERPINVEYYEKDGTQGINQRAGVRIFGGFSKGLPMKSLAIISRKKYERKYFKYPIFREKPKLKKFKSFILRNSGGDFNKTHFRDALITQLTRPIELPIQAYQPVVVYINGAYWGIHNAREKLNEYYFKFNYDADPDSIDIMKHRNDLQEGQRKHYKALLDYMARSSFTENAMIEELDKKMNIDNYIDHHIAQVYCDNGDAGGNIRYWRPQRKNARWNWVLFDTDLSMGIGNWKAYKVNTLKEMTTKSNEKWPNPAWSTFIIRKLLENDSIKQLYITRCANYLNTIYSEETVVRTIDSIENLIKPEMPEHQKKWGGKMEKWERNVQVLRDFALNRPHYMRKHMQEVFGLNDTVVVRVKANVEGVQSVKFGEQKIKDSFTGVYFRQFPMELKVKVKTGYLFKGWKGLESADKQITIFPKGDMDIEPIVEKRPPSPYWNKVVFNELRFSKPQGQAETNSLNQPRDWIEIYNVSQETVDLKGWKLKIGKGEKDQRLLDFKINPGEYLVLAEDKEALLAASPSLDGRRVMQCDHLNLEKEGFRLFLLDAEKNIVDSLNVASPDESGLLCLINPKNNLHSVASWEATEEATPNEANPSEKNRIEKEEQNNLLFYIGGLSLFGLGLILLIIYRLRKKSRNSLLSPHST